MDLAARLGRIEEPQTIKMAKLSRALKAEGVDVIDLSLGEPDFATPNHIKQAAKDALDAGFTKYPPVAGFPELKNAIINKFKRDNNLTYNLEEVMACTGAKQCIANAMMCLINDDDEVIIPSPYWVTYGDLVKVCGGHVIEVKADIKADFKISPEQLKAAITSKSKVMIFSSPSNPTGSIYSKDELQALANVLIDYPQITIISDEIYEHINFEGQHHSIAQLDGFKERTIVINGLSKAYAMTGWRLGYMAGPKEIIKACETMQSQFTSGPNSITQRAAIVALESNIDTTTEMVNAFKERRDYLVKAINEIPGFICNCPPGAFYIFPEISAFIGKKFNGEIIASALDFCMLALNHAHVSCVTGEAFGDANCIRISYATSMDQLKKAVERLALFTKLIKA
jgi:aspartate aminotransferase